MTYGIRGGSADTAHDGDEDMLFDGEWTRIQ